jgi:predicted DCC family thiol-disulfide oxidoreductase YuxK
MSLLQLAIAGDWTWRIIVSFFTTKTSPMNLAIFRIAVFGVTLAVLGQIGPATMWFSSFPHQLQIAPFGIGWLLPYVPISRPLVVVASSLLIVVCIAGFIGLFARASALLGLLLGLYVFGITQVYGKVSHDHVLIWFMAILAASPCSDALSIDAIFASRKRADRGITEPLPPSISYALPLRFASLLLGLIYFFPGFWKLWGSGFAWALSDNMKFQMYSKWMEFGGWTPVFRLDWHPWIYRFLAFETMVFEMSFVFLVFFPRLRRIAALGGVAFHFGSLIFLRIFFYDLLIFYVALFDVSGWLRRVGHRIFKVPLTVFYDGDCRLCRRTIAAIRVVDILECINYVNARERAGLDLWKGEALDQKTLLHNMHAITDGRHFVGFAAYRSMAIRIPVLLPLVPVLFLPPVESVADRFYSHVAQARTCSLPEGKLPPAFGESRNSSAWNPVLVVGLLLLSASVYTGIRGITSGWPFACYPTFAGIAGDEIPSMEVVALAANGEPILESSALKQKFMDQRLYSLLVTQLGRQRQSGTDEPLRALWQLYVETDPRLRNASVVRFYRVTLCNIPERQNLNPVRRELLREIAL